MLGSCLYYGIGSNFIRCFGHARAIRGHQAGRDGGLRLGTAFKQTALYQQTIGASTFDHTKSPKWNKLIAKAVCQMVGS
jgi:hypothetical protein